MFISHIFIHILFQSHFSIENLIIDANKLPPYLPERKGYTTFQFKNKKNGVMEDISTMTVYFEMESTGINRLKNIAKKKN